MEIYLTLATEANLKFNHNRMTNRSEAII